jgi:DNA (cytosine-5)-methyltransferase 1
MARFNSIHLFAGGGGDLIASEMIGGEGVMAANHWRVAIEAHGGNFPHVDHLMGDLAIADPSQLGGRVHDAHVLCASPECDGWSLSRNHAEEVSRLGPFDPNQGIGRSRATVWCPMRFATALPNLTTIILEQVVDMVREAKAFANYVEEWDKLGWRVQAVSANSSIWGAAPQSRDRLYLLITRKGVPKPDLDFRPPCRCLRCDADVHGIQTWKAKALSNATSAGPVGKYGPRSGQYYYRCPNCSTPDENVTVVPYIIPAAAAIDWSILGTRIGDRETPLASATMRRIETGLKRWHAEQLATLSRLNDPKRDEPVPLWMPYPTQTARQDIALVAPPAGTRPVDASGYPLAAQVVLRNHGGVAPITEPWRTVCASGNHLGIVEPPSDAMLVQAAGHTFERPGYARAWNVNQPSPLISGTLDKAVVVPPDNYIPAPGEAFAVANYGNKSRAGGHVRDVTEQPLGTLTAGGQYGITQQSILRFPREAVIASYYSASTVIADAHTEPCRTQTGVDRHALIEPKRVTEQGSQPATNGEALASSDLPYDIADSTFRMITPEECARVMAIDRRIIPQDDGTYQVVPYKLAGNKRDRVRLAGNSLTPGVEAQILDRALTAQGA